MKEDQFGQVVEEKNYNGVIGFIGGIVSILAVFALTFYMSDTSIFIPDLKVKENHWLLYSPTPEDLYQVKTLDIETMEEEKVDAATFNYTFSTVEGTELMIGLVYEMDNTMFTQMQTALYEQPFSTPDEIMNVKIKLESSNNIVYVNFDEETNHKLRYHRNAENEKMRLQAEEQMAKAQNQIREAQMLARVNLEKQEAEYAVEIAKLEAEKRSLENQ